MPKNDDSLEELESVSIKELLTFFKGPSAVRDSKKALTGARLALGTLSAVGRLKATMRVKDATQLEVLKNVADNKEQFKKFAAASLPHLVPKKLITATPKSE
jgi:hypothetical protein